jgi:adenosylhomocysteine nucleosidase
VITFVLATEAEAAGLREALGDGETTLPDGNPCRIVVTGMGPVAAARSVADLLAEGRPTKLVNVGLCGALRDDLPPGSVIQISSAHDGDAILTDAPASPLTCDSLGPWPRRELATVSVPVFEPDRRSVLAERADVVDMEGFFLARQAVLSGVSIAMVKIVSDLANASGREDLLRRLAPLSRALAREVLAVWGP